MSDSDRKTWLRTAVLVGVVYCVVGFISAALAAAATTGRMQFVWRLSAFVVSAVVCVAHISYEHFRPGSSARSTAWHTFVGAALGGLGLAIAANIHDLGTAAGYRPKMLIALVAWPLLTGMPVLIFAFAAAAFLGLKRRRTESISK